MKYTDCIGAECRDAQTKQPCGRIQMIQRDPAWCWCTSNQVMIDIRDWRNLEVLVHVDDQGQETWEPVEGPRTP